MRYSQSDDDVWPLIGSTDLRREHDLGMVKVHQQPPITSPLEEGGGGLWRGALGFAAAPAGTKLEEMAGRRIGGDWLNMRR